ncbi:hypothetical protein A4D02_28230 [Niastella koreensis]|uniref:DUF4302 domain-containing protein n=2 Tax=Niastella koreensis TaxID=354356 RepID=G8T9M0_NIAKG|nr:DUF4302 domain-containing protein [Niastella koreensis]AEW00213.1 hypothetical protein Niako_3930 [Niastella koreensis GR20-10]OQP49486.1 hypothetical protein A4D02_28230 [Niastella koreensis]
MKIIAHIILVTIILTSCNKDKSPFDKSVDDRINEQLGSYQQVISGAANGWTATLITKPGNTYSFYFRFNDSNRVFMYCDFDTTTAGVLKESSYRLKSLQQPCLIFDTYSYVHLLADPDASKNGGVYGGGLLSDFEFSIDTCTTDSIKLTGRFNGSAAILRKASAQDRAAWENKAVRNNLVGLNNLGKILNYFKRLTYNGTDYEIRFIAAYKVAIITWKDAAGMAHTVTTPYYISPSGIVFPIPVVNGSTTITGLNITGYNTTTNTVQVRLNNTDATIAGAIRPVNPDVQAARRWWQWGADAQSYWFSWNGFHADGVDDAFKLKTLQTDTSQFYYLTYWPGVQPSSGSSFDALIPFYYIPRINDIDFIYGTAPKPTFQSDGRVQFSLLSDLTVGPYPTTGPASKTKDQFFNSNGYWFVQTGENSYDMVSAKDAKTWITWQH